MKFGGVTITSGTRTIDDRTDWTGREIRGSEKKTVVGSWFGAIFPAVIASLFFWHAHMPFFISKNVPNPIYCVFGLVTVGLILKAIWETVRLKRFGDPVLELNTAPIALGGTVEGRINLSRGTDQAPEFTVTLACIHYTHGSGQNSNGVEKVLWSTERKTSVLLGGTLPISIPVPDGQPQTNGADPFDRIFWRVTVKAPFRGQAFLQKYEIPVGHAPSAPTAQS